MKDLIKHIIREETEPNDIDKKLLNFLLRRVRIEEKNLGTDWFDNKPLRVTEYKFEEFPGYGFNSFNNKRQMEYKINEMLYENDIIDDIFEMDERNPERIKIVKTIRHFLNRLLGI